jgi:hypothetical protein
MSVRAAYPWKRCRNEAEATLEWPFWLSESIARAVHRWWSD